MEARRRLFLAWLWSIATAGIILIVGFSVLAAEAKTRHVLDANGNSAGVVRSHKTGATARVGAAYAARFQAYVDDLENNHGAVIKFMGGIRRGKCWSGGMHPCGKALDICQLSRGRVDARCNLPSRNQIIAIARRHGLQEGGEWCRHDYGHVQAGVSAPACGSYASAKRRHHRHRVAER